MRVLCPYCPRRCSIPEGGRGFCGSFANRGGRLVNLGYGKVSAIESRPIEIKPFYHFWPNSTAMTFSGYGCNMSCPWCQNWPLSRGRPEWAPRVVEPWEIAERALKAGDQGVCASFNEPIVFGDYLVDVFRESKKMGLYTTMVTNGYTTLEFLSELVSAGLDAMSIDVKGCPESYRRFQHVPDPEPIFAVIEEALRRGVHVELVFLIVPGANDSEECLRWAFKRAFEASGPETPVHVNRYYPSYRYSAPPTGLDSLLGAARMAREEGFHYVYVGNISDWELSTTRCPSCGHPVIRRRNFRVVDVDLRNGRCPVCGHRIPLRGRVIGFNSKRK